MCHIREDHTFVSSIWDQDPPWWHTGNKLLRPGFGDHVDVKEATSSRAGNELDRRYLAKACVAKIGQELPACPRIATNLQ
jgi:hypothetical protein